MPALVADAGLLDFNGTFIAEVIAFILMIVVLAKVAYPRIIRIAEAREKQIEAGLRAAQEAEERLKTVQEQVQRTLDEARAQAREILGRASSDAVVEAEEQRNRARSEAEAIITRARIEIEAERDRAVQELRAEASTLVVEATSRILGEVLDARAHERLIEDALAKMGGPQSGSERN